MKAKTLEVEVKALGVEGSGRFQAYASVFGNVDSYGDMVVKGAFEESLAEYAAADAPVPLYWRHAMHDPFMNVGTAECREDDHGLLVDCQLDLETASGKQIHKLLKQKRVRQMSFAYDVVEGAWVQSEDHGEYYELRKLKLHEVSIVPIGANHDTEILTVKTAVDVVLAGVKSGRGLTVDEQQDARAAYKALGSLLEEGPGGEPEPHETKTDEKAEEPVPSARALAMATIQSLK